MRDISDGFGKLFLMSLISNAHGCFAVMISFEASLLFHSLKFYGVIFLDQFDKKVKAMAMAYPYRVFLWSLYVTQYSLIDLTSEGALYYGWLTGPTSLIDHGYVFIFTYFGDAITQPCSNFRWILPTLVTSSLKNLGPFTNMD